VPAALPAQPPLRARPLEPPCARWLQELQVQRRLAERTCAMYRDALVRLQDFAAQAHVELHRVEPHHVRRWAAQLNAQGLAPRSIAIHLAAWRGLYRSWCRQTAPLPGRGSSASATSTASATSAAPAPNPLNNPVDGLRAPKARRPLPKALAVDQAVSLAEHERSQAHPNFDPVLEARDHAIVELLYGAGLRVAELCSLDHPGSAASVGWLDLASGDTHVLGKGSKRRSVPLGGKAIEAVQTWLEHRPALANEGETALFTSRRGSRLTDGQLRRRLAERARDAGISTPVHPHMLRHSYASHLLQSSGDLRAVQELLGHAQISTTQVYTRLDFQHLAKVYDAAHPRAKKKA
jgi:integrase/recombinase XerC